MAVVTLILPTDMSAVQTSRGNGGAISEQATYLSSLDPFGMSVAYYGSFSYGGDPVQMLGTVNHGVFYLPGTVVPMLEITGLSFTPTYSFTTAFEDGNINKQIELLLDGNDRIVGSTGGDTLYGFGGNDTLTGGAGTDVLNGGLGTNTASYSTAKAGLFAGLEDTNANTGDALGDRYANIQNLTGSKYADTLYGDANANGFSGGDGNDLMVGKGGGDSFNGGNGSDTVGYDADFAGVIADLLNPSRNTSTAAGDTYTSIENLDGSTHNDKLYGDNRDNILASNVYSNTPSGDDQMFGRNGNDVLKGYDGKDRLSGGAGHDTLTGGSGSDHFVFDAAVVSANSDKIKDFDHFDDLFDLDHHNFIGAASSAGQLSKSAFKLLSSAQSTTGVDASDRILYDKAHGDIYYDRDGSGKAYDRVKFAEIADKTSIDHTDFFIF